MTTRVYVLLGGFFPGPDGWVTSAGMHVLANQLAAIPNTFVQTFQWSSYAAAAKDMQKAAFNDKIVAVGYSGGGSRATWLNRDFPKIKIDLMVLYDPSPSWQMVNINAQVKRALCYHNTAPFFFGLGGGVLVGPNVQTINIAENHMAVQADSTLHERTIAEVKKL